MFGVNRNEQQQTIGQIEPSCQQLLSVGVLVDLEWGVHSGGHVKCWERFAEAAAEIPELDLTIYYLGQTRSQVEIAPNVRYQLLPPVFGTRHIPFLNEGSRNTDLAAYHPELARQLVKHDVLHFTSAFTFSRTACQVAQRQTLPLVCSTHTNLPKFTQIYSKAIMTRFLGHGWFSKLLFDRFHLDQYLAKRMAQQWQSLMLQSDWVLISENDRELQKMVPSHRQSGLRRGIDKQRFHPAHRDRDRLQTTFGIAPHLPVLLFVGRVDDSKKVMTLARAARHLLDTGHALHVLVLGEGSASVAIQQLLQSQVTLPGMLPQPELAWIYASADLFVFPSESEVSPNVVLEAKSSGLPVFVSAHDRGARFVQQSGVDGVTVADPDPAAWAIALSDYVKDATLRARVGLAARRQIEQCYSSWAEVLRTDLLPVWQRVSSCRFTS